MAEPSKAESSAGTAKKKSSALDDDMSKDFLSSWKSMSVAGNDDMDFNFEPVAKGKKKAFDFGMDMDFSLDDAFGKMPAFKLDMPDIDFSSSPKKATKAKEKSGEEESSKGSRQKEDMFNFSFDFNGLDDFLSSKGEKNPSEEKRREKLSPALETEKEDSPNQNLSDNGARREDAKDKQPLASEDASHSKSELSMECETTPDVACGNSPPKSTMEVYVIQPDETPIVFKKKLAVESQETEPESHQEGETSLKKSYDQGRASNDSDGPSSEGDSKTLNDRSSSCEQVSPYHEIEREDSPRQILKINGVRIEDATDKRPSTTEDASDLKSESLMDCETNLDVSSGNIPSNSTTSVDNGQPEGLQRFMEKKLLLNSQETELQIHPAGEYSSTKSFAHGRAAIDSGIVDTQKPTTAVDKRQPEGLQRFLEKQLVVNAQETEPQIHPAEEPSPKKSFAHGRAAIDSVIVDTQKSVLALDKRQPEGFQRFLEKKLVVTAQEKEPQIQLAEDSSSKKSFAHGRAAAESDIVETQKSVTALDKRQPEGFQRFLEKKLVVTAQETESQIQLAGDSSKKSFTHGRAAVESDIVKSQKSKFDQGNKLPSLRADKKLALLPTLKVSKTVTSNKQPSTPIVQQNLKSMGKFDKSTSLQVTSKMVCPVNAGKQTPSTPSLKRKPDEAADTGALMLHPSKRLSPSENRMSLVSAGEIVNEVRTQGILLERSRTNAAAEHQSPKIHFQPEANMEDLGFALMVESDANVEKAEACAKELDDICNMLKKKHEEAKELLVRVLVNNNNLLMLNHPIYDEKIRLVQRFASRLMPAEQEAGA